MCGVCMGGVHARVVCCTHVCGICIWHVSVCICYIWYMCMCEVGMYMHVACTCVWFKCNVCVVCIYGGGLYECVVYVPVAPECMYIHVECTCLFNPAVSPSAICDTLHRYV